MIKTIFEHRSVRSYKPDPVDEALLQRILEAGTRASNTGNMQIYSIIVTTTRRSGNNCRRAISDNRWSLRPRSC